MLDQYMKKHKLLNRHNLVVVPFMLLSVLFFLSPVEGVDKKTPYFISELWPEEGSPQFRAIKNLQLHKEPKKTRLSQKE